jgi:hypothetical protein
VDFHQFFDGLRPLEQRAFARRAGYSAASLRIHFACPGFRRRQPSGPGFARLVAACEHFPGAPSQAELFEYFYRPSRRRRRQAPADAAA